MKGRYIWELLGDIGVSADDTTSIALDSHYATMLPVGYLVIIGKLQLLKKAFGSISEYVSSDGGETWVESPIVEAGAAELTNLIATTVAVPREQRERILINWTGAYNRSDSPPANHRKIFILERIFD